MNEFLRKVYVALAPNSMNLKTTLDDGSVIVGQNAPGHGGRGVFIFKDELEIELKYLDCFIGEGDVAIDGGANVGVYTVKLGRLVGDSGCVVAVEPFPSSAAVNLKNILRNGLRNVRLRICALSNKKGRSEFFLRNNNPTSYTLLDDGSSASFNTRVTSIDDLVEEEELTHVSFLKLDVEGVENEVIEGAKKTIERFKPVILAEHVCTGEISNLRDYTVLQYKGSPNVLMFPKGSKKIQALLDKGFVDV